MSQTTKTIVILIVLAAAAYIGWSVMSKTGSSMQPDQSGYTTSASDTSDAAINQDMSNIDTQMKQLNTDANDLDSSMNQ